MAVRLLLPIWKGIENWIEVFKSFQPTVSFICENCHGVANRIRWMLKGWSIQRGVASKTPRQLIKSLPSDDVKWCFFYPDHIVCGWHDMIRCASKGFLTAEWLTLATVAVLIQLESLSTIALVHAIVQFVAELLTRTALATSSWNENRVEED